MDQKIENNAGLALLRSRLYQLLAGAFLHPNEEFSKTVGDGSFCLEMAQLLKGIIQSKNPRLLDEWQQLAERTLSPEELLESYQQIFSHTISQSCPPCEMEYERTHVFQLTQQLADLSGFYRAFGAQLVERSGERVDHVAVQMEFMSWLTLKEAYFSQVENDEARKIIVDAQRKFFKDHLGRWAQLFLQKVLRQHPANFYRLIADSAVSFLEFEKNLLGVNPQRLRDTDFQLMPNFEDEQNCGIPESCPGC